MTQQEKLAITVEALKELLDPKGIYSEDRLTHACNTIKETADIAKEALLKIGEIK